MHPVERRRIVAVVGPGDAGGQLYEVAREVGAAIAVAGWVVLNGGLGGVMEASARGAAEAGGCALGLLPGDDAGDANGWVTFACPTGLGELRNALIARMCSGMVAVGGSWGTESEIALAMRLGKPVAAIRGWARETAGGARVAGVHDAADAGGAVAYLARRFHDEEPRNDA